MNGAEFKQWLAAILAADAAGYSRLMARDERATLAALDEARSVFKGRVESNRGRVVDMAGDSVLAVFQTATGAVLAALAIQEDLAALSAHVPEERQLCFRIGLHLGDVIEKPDGTIYGEGVNIASRLQGLAEAGGIVVSESIRIAVRGTVDTAYEDKGEQKVKNIPEPVRAYRIVHSAEKPTLTRSSTASLYRELLLVRNAHDIAALSEQVKVRLETSPQDIALRMLSRQVGKVESSFASSSATIPARRGAISWLVFAVMTSLGVIAYLGNRPAETVVSVPSTTAIDPSSSAVPVTSIGIDGKIRKKGTSARDVCAGQGTIAEQVCLHRECAKPELHDTADCRDFEREQRDRAARTGSSSPTDK